MRFKAGDVIQFKRVKNIKRVIKEVNENGYTYTMVDQDRLYDSSTHPDSFFEDGWQLAK